MEGVSFVLYAPIPQNFTVKEPWTGLIKLLDWVVADMTHLGVESLYFYFNRAGGSGDA